MLGVGGDRGDRDGGGDREVIGVLDGDDQVLLGARGGGDLDGVVAPTAALLDIIRSKTAANRPKDQASLPVLEELARKLGLVT